MFFFNFFKIARDYCNNNNIIYIYMCIWHSAYVEKYTLYEWYIVMWNDSQTVIATWIHTYRVSRKAQWNHFGET